MDTSPVPDRLPRAILLHPNDGCLTIARTLVRRGVAVHALPDERHSYVLASRGVTGRVLPDPRDDPGAWSAQLRALAADGGGVLISGSDAACEWVQRHRAELPSSLRSFETAAGAHRMLMNKFELYRVAARAGLRTPWMHHVASRADFDAVRDEVGFPCILKPDLGHLAKAAMGVGTQRIGSADALDEQAARLLDLGLTFLLTELVPGPETGLVGAVTIRDAHGDYPLSYGRRKIRQWPLDYGTGTLLESADQPEAMAAARRLLDHTGFVGLSSCEFKRHSDTGELCLMEINVRVPANFGLAQACGADGVWRLFASLAGLEPGPAPRPVPGRKVFLHPDLIAAFSRVRRGELSTVAALGSWRGVRDSGVLAARDPGPVLALARQVLGRRVAALRGRRRLPPTAAPAPVARETTPA